MTSSLTNAEKRKVWMECYRTVFMSPECIAQGEQEALRRYPDPKEPTVIACDNGLDYRINPKTQNLEYRRRGVATAQWISLRGYTVSFCLALGEIAQEAQQQMEEK